MGLEIKKGDHIIFLVDRSGSMDTQDCDGATRYTYAKEKIKAFIRGASKYDTDGVSVHLFNQRVEPHENITSPEAVDKLIEEHRPAGGTETHLALQYAWNEHKKRGSQGTYVMVFTDGEPNQPQEVENTIVNITKTMTSPEEFRLSFLTVGKRAPELDAWLEKLDSSLTGAKYDIVGVDTLDAVDFDQAIADLVGSTTTKAEAASGKVVGKGTTRV